MGARRPRRPRGRCVRLGRRALPGRQRDGQLLAGRVPVAEPEGGWLRGDVPGRELPTQRVRPLRHDRERLGVDLRLVRAEASGRGREPVLRPEQPARDLAGRELQPGPAGREYSPPRDQGRLAPLRAQLLPPLPAGGPPAADDRHVDGAPRLPLHRAPARPEHRREGAPDGRQAEHPRHLGRRHRHHQPQLLQRRVDGVPDAEHRPHRERGHALHGLLRRAELHRWPGVVHHRAECLPHGAQQSRPTRSGGRTAGRGSHHRGAPEEPRLRDGPIRQEPPRRPQRVPTDRPRLRRVLREPLPPERRGGPGGPGLPGQARLRGVPGALRPARGAALQGDEQGRPEGAPALGSRRCAEDRGHGPAHPQADGDVRRRVRRRGVRLHPAPAQSVESRSSAG